MFAVVLSSTALAGSVTTSNGASCNDNYNFNKVDSGRSVEFNARTNDRGNSEFSLTYKIDLGGKRTLYNGSINTLDCTRMLQTEERKQELELQRMQLEIKILKEQLANAEAQNKPQSIQSSDDW